MAVPACLAMYRDNSSQRSFYRASQRLFRSESIISRRFANRGFRIYLGTRETRPEVTHGRTRSGSKGVGKSRRVSRCRPLFAAILVIVN